MFSQWVFLSVLALAVPSFAWAEDAVSDLAKEQSKAEQGDKRGSGWKRPHSSRMRMPSPGWRAPRTQPGTPAWKTGFTLRWMESCPASPTAPVPPIAGTRLSARGLRP